MSVSKLKVLLITSIIGSAGLAAPAYAQLTTEDVDSNSYLQDIREESREFRNDHIEPHYQSQITHHQTQVTHYETEIKRLNTMIRSLGYRVAEADNEAVNTETMDGAIFTPLTNSNDARSKVSNTRNGTSEVYGIKIGTGSPTSIPPSFYQTFQIAAPNAVYDEDNPKYIGVKRLHDALYLNETTVGEVDASRENRLEAYDLLLAQARDAGDLQTALKVNNAILLENGRNLALMINLQTAQLNAESTKLRKDATTREATARAFGDTGEDLAVISGMLAGIELIF